MIGKYFSEVKQSVASLPNHLNHRPLFFAKECRSVDLAHAFLVLGCLCIIMSTAATAAGYATHLLKEAVIQSLVILFGAGLFLVLSYAWLMRGVHRNMQRQPSADMLDWLNRLSSQEGVSVKSAPKTKKEFASYMMQAYLIREKRIQEAGVYGVFRGM